MKRTLTLTPVSWGRDPALLSTMKTSSGIQVAGRVVLGGSLPFQAPGRSP